jgi:hypothetical protein
MADTPTCNGVAAVPQQLGCLLSRCGDGYTNAAAGEECDTDLGAVGDSRDCNGPAAGSQGCKPPRCGDEYVNAAAGEECDTGLAGDTATCIGSAADPAFACQTSRCGDTYVNTAAQEICDDGNASACGTCSADCTSSQTGGDCPLGTGCVSNADCDNSDCRGVCVQAP